MGLMSYGDDGIALGGCLDEMNLFNYLEDGGQLSATVRYCGQYLMGSGAGTRFQIYMATYYRKDLGCFT